MKKNINNLNFLSSYVLISFAAMVALLVINLFMASKARAASLSLSPSSINMNVGDTATVTVILNAQSENVDGVDLFYINYAPDVLEVLDDDSTTAGIQITSGNLLPATLANTADNQLGRLVFSQVIAPGGAKYTGTGNLATFRVRALKAGSGNLSFDFTLGRTNDTNVAGLGVDILTQVTNGVYTVTAVSNPPSGGGGGGGGGGGSSSGGGGSSGGSFTPSPTPTPTQSPAGQPATPTGSNYIPLKLINLNGTYYVVKDGQRLGITNPGMLFSYGLEFKDASLPTTAEALLPEGPILSPGDGALVKSPLDPTVYLISLGKKHGFNSEATFRGLGFSFTKVLVVTAPELDKMPLGEVLTDPTLPHKPGTDINIQGTIYYIGSDSKRYGYPTETIWNSWHFDNDFSNVVIANQADLSLQVGDVVSLRKIE